jgi:hypothetical protein
MIKTVGSDYPQSGGLPPGEHIQFLAVTLVSPVLPLSYESSLRVGAHAHREALSFLTEDSGLTNALLELVTRESSENRGAEER